MLKRNLALAGSMTCALALSLALTGCGGGKGPSKPSSSTPASSGTSASAPAEPTAPAVDNSVLPEDVETGLQEYNDVTGTSDVWYRGGDPANGGLVLTPCSSDYGVLAVGWVDADGNLVPEESDWNSTEPHNYSEDGHLFSREDIVPAYDLVFDDPMTCFDMVSGDWFYRGDMSYDDYTACFAGQTIDVWGSETDFAADGTFTFHGPELEETGTWQVTAPNVLYLHFEGDSEPEVVTFAFLSTGDIVIED